VLCAGINGRYFFAEGVNNIYGLIRRRYATGQHWTGDSVSVVSHEGGAVGSQRGSPGNDKLMRRETRSLICLEHTVPKRILLSHSKIGLDIRWIDVRKLRVPRRTVLRSAQHFNFISAVHLAIIEHADKCFVLVVEVEVRSQREGTEGDLLTFRVYTAVGNVRSCSDQRWILKQVIGSSIFLKDDYDVLEFPRQYMIALQFASAAVHGCDQRNECEQNDDE
jgi:hypothetical protein